MNLDTRKIEFVQEFLKLQNEALISRLEKVLRKEKDTLIDEAFEPFTKDELNQRIEQSEANFENNEYKSSSELLAKYQ